MKHLPVFALSHVDHLVQPEEFHDVELNSPALAIMTDFRSHKPHMVNREDLANLAAEQMAAESVAHKLVVDKSFELVGIVNKSRLSAHNLQLKRNELGLTASELNVGDVMLARKDIQAIDFDVLVKATVGDVVSSLKKYQQEYLLVVDRENHHIRGVVSADMIAQRLHQAVDIHRNLTFVDIFTAIHAH